MTLGRLCFRLWAMLSEGTRVGIGSDHDNDVFEGSLAEALAVQRMLRLFGVAADVQELPLTAVPTPFFWTLALMACVKVDPLHGTRARGLISSHQTLSRRAVKSG